MLQIIMLCIITFFIILIFSIINSIIFSKKREQKIEKCKAKEIGTPFFDILIKEQKEIKLKKSIFNKIEELENKKLLAYLKGKKKRVNELELQIKELEKIIYK